MQSPSCLILLLIGATPALSIDIITCNVTTLWISVPVPRGTASPIISAAAGTQNITLPSGDTVLAQIEFDDFTACVNPSTHLPLGGFMESSVQFSHGVNSLVKGCDADVGCNLQLFAFTDDLLGKIGLASVDGRNAKVQMGFESAVGGGSAWSGKDGAGMNATWTPAGEWKPAGSMSGEGWSTMRGIKTMNEMCCKKKGLFGHGPVKCECSAQVFEFGNMQVREIQGTAHVGPLFAQEVTGMGEWVVDLTDPGVLAYEVTTVYSAALSC
eukprot:TRINITY_DN19592_c0_g1_i3.p1 TRINITY_DN19592_c0_g1~~TRINITY_DN19592_c0_g1_i3.p1  ORF type:complete len:269 (+),score=72.24 TRINITY_DN19592_c0_g1_i3:236-1042(+)